MPLIGEPYDQDYYHTFSLIRPEGYHDYPDGNLDGQLFINIADDIEAHPQIGPVAGLDVLDVGCAYGYLTNELVQRGANVIGIDISAWAIAQAQALFPGLTFVQDDVINSPFSNNQFDLLVVCGVLECMADDPTIGQFLNELNRILPNNRWMYFLIENNFGPEPIYQQRTAAEWQTALNAGIPGPFDFDVQDVGHLPLYYGTRAVVF
jgi:SAM-dependent methyltransferase